MFSFIYIFLIVICEILMFVSGIITLLFTFPFDKDRRIIHYHSCAWGLIHYWINPWWKIRYTGKENIDRKKTYIIISNHQSMLDICLLYKVPKLFKWVSKKEAQKIPFVGWALWLHKDVLISRGNSSSIKTMIRDCQAYLRRNVSIMMFPEGTRSKDGRVRAFKEGAFVLAKMTKTAILPIVIDGAYNVMPKKGLRLKRKQLFQIRVLPEVSEEEVGKKSVKELAQQLYENIRAEHEVMAPEKYRTGAGETPFGVIFDMDGVIVDNNACHNEAFRLFLRKHGFDDPDKVFTPSMYGTRNIDIMREIFGEETDMEKIAALAEEKEAIYRELYRPQMQEVKGLTALLKSLKAHGIPMAIGSSASMANIHFILDGLQIREYFEAVTHERMVANGKPNPEVYLKTAALLRLHPSQCIVFEDSIAGVQAGKNAGMKVVGITTTNSAEQLEAYTLCTAPDFKNITFEQIANIFGSSPDS